MSPYGTRADTHITYAEELARGLLAYAKEDPAFTTWLITELCAADIWVADSLTYNRPGHVPALVPRTSTQAFERALWLIGNIERRTISGYQSAALLLSQSLTREREEPKAIVLGIEIGVLPIGLMGKMKTRREPMTIIVEEGSAARSALHTAAHTTALTHRIVEQALIAAQGHTAYLEPEVGDWLFGDKTLTYYQASRRSLSTIQAYLGLHELPYAATSDPYGTLLALSPSLYVEDLPEYANLEPLSLS